MKHPTGTLTEGVKITSLEIENVKRVRAVSLDCEGKALSIVGGRNGQGKTSVLDSIMWALGGDRYRPTTPIRNGADNIHIKIELDNGVSVERNGTTGSLKVTSAKGKGGQALLNEFVNGFALDLPKFMAARGAEKAQALMDSFPGIGVRIKALNVRIKTLYDERHATGVIADRKKKYAAELPYDHDAPEVPLSGAEMTKRMQECLTVNALHTAMRQDAVRAETTLQDCITRQSQASARVDQMRAALDAAIADFERANVAVMNAKTALSASQSTVAQLKDADTTLIQKELEQLDAINARIRANESKRNADAEATTLAEQYAELGRNIEALRAERLAMLASVAMPLPGLSIDEEGELIFNGAQWDCMSGSEQLRVATAIAAAMKPECGFILLDRLECMDIETLREFGAWLAERGLQAIGTRVGSGEESSIIIEDGVSREGQDALGAPTEPFTFD
jgi:exonuclease VII small subunit